MNTIEDEQEINSGAKEVIIPIVHVIARTEVHEETIGLILGGSHLWKIDDAGTTAGNLIEDGQIALGDTMKRDRRDW